MGSDHNMRYTLVLGLTKLGSAGGEHISRTSKSCQQRARHEWLLGQRIILVVDYFGGAIAGLSSVVDALLHAVSDRPAMAGILLAPGEFSSL